MFIDFASKKLIFNKIIRFFFKKIDALKISLYEEATYKMLNISNKNAKIEMPHHIVGFQYIQIGDYFNSRYNLRIEAIDNYGDEKFEPRIIIGNNVSMNTDIHIGAINLISIGNNVLIGSKVLITDHSHGQFRLDDIKLPPAVRSLYSRGPVIIKDNVWIGENVSILPGVIIGDNVVIGANSVVTRDIPSNSLACGNPAVVIKSL